MTLQPTASEIEFGANMAEAEAVPHLEGQSDVDDDQTAEDNW